jgi:hypothetical protein
VAHRQPVDHDVDRPPGGGDEVHLPVAVEVVEHAVGLASAVGQVGGDLLAFLGQARVIDVLVTAEARRIVRAQDPHGEPAEQLEPDSGPRGALGQRHCLRQRIAR